MKVLAIPYVNPKNDQKVLKYLKKRVGSLLNNQPLRGLGLWGWGIVIFL